MTPRAALVLAAVFLLTMATPSLARALTLPDFELVGTVIELTLSERVIAGTSFVGAWPLGSVQLPGELFEDGQARELASITEHGLPATWTLTALAGGEWRSDLSDVQLRVEYAGDVDNRLFILDGFIADRMAGELQLHPPTAGSGDWRGRVGQNIVVQFWHRSAPPPAAIPPALVDPVTDSGTFMEFLVDETPGGPITLQGLFTILVYAGVLATCSSRRPFTIFVAAIVLVMTPWIPVAFGVGSTIAASIMLLNVCLGAFSWKVFAARTEA